MDSEDYLDEYACSICGKCHELCNCTNEESSQLIEEISKNNKLDDVAMCGRSSLEELQKVIPQKMKRYLESEIENTKDL